MGAGRRVGEQVAELHGGWRRTSSANLLDAVGRLYNLALLGVERNNHGHSTLNTLRNVCRYPRLYYHVDYDVVGKAKPVLGWPTDLKTKPLLVDDLRAAIATRATQPRSSAFIDECMTFITTDTGSQEAQEGKHDDRVIAYGIAWQVRKRGRHKASAERPAGW